MDMCCLEFYDDEMDQKQMREKTIADCQQIMISRFQRKDQLRKADAIIRIKTDNINTQSS